ncbi:hypothetical protein [Pyrodictium delaneyi]|uniref:hypothetical protein n=1 Tax=Pyrodictium delaneyi TaxID=1273541 RepID=UPI001E49BE2A|nr:hypothetical protein [Pyrodictium delaneyi]
MVRGKAGGERRWYDVGGEFGNPVRVSVGGGSMDVVVLDIQRGRALEGTVDIQRLLGVLAEESPDVFMGCYSAGGAPCVYVPRPTVILAVLEWLNKALGEALELNRVRLSEIEKELSSMDSPSKLDYEYVRRAAEASIHWLIQFRSILGWLITITRNPELVKDKRLKVTAEQQEPSGLDRYVTPLAANKPASTAAEG